MLTEDEREALTRAVQTYRKHGVGLSPVGTDTAIRAVIPAVEAIVAERVAAARAEAWDEGYSHLFDADRTGNDASLRDNPYRRAHATGGES